jgi:hypothetical protein
VRIIAENDMIFEWDLEDLTHLDQLPRHLDVLRAWIWIPRGMLVSHDDTGRGLGRTRLPGPAVTVQALTESRRSHHGPCRPEW